MKKIAAWAYLVIYLNAAAQSLLPWASDCIAHIFFWQDHFEHVHNGHIHSHHVGLEMADQANAANNPSHPDHLPSYNQDVLSAHYVPVLAVPLRLATIVLLSLNIWWSFNYFNISLDIFLPPPDRAL